MTPEYHKRIRPFGVSQKISIGFGVVLVLHIMIAILNHVGLEQARDDFDAYQRHTQAAQQVVEIDLNAFQLQRSIMLFIHTGNAGTGRRVAQLYDELRQKLESEIDATADRDTRDTFLNMLDLLERYMEDFDVVKEDREHRRHLAYEVIPQIREEAADRLSRITREMLAREDFRVAALAGITQEHLMATSIDVMTYLHSPDSALVENALKVLEDCRAAVDRLACEVTDSATMESVETVRALIPEYERTLLRMVQTTRGYLHLVNVVMAGEAAEFVRFSDEFKRSTFEEVDALAARMVQEADQFQKASNAVSIATIMMGILAAWIIGRNVVPPLNAITETLTHLSQDELELEADIPGLDRSDEIGQMAAAAQVFQGKAKKTRALLIESQRLGEELMDKSEEMERFVYTVSHDLKSPLVSFTGLIGAIREDLRGGDIEEVELSFDRVQRNVRRMELCINDLIELSRVGRVRHEPESIDMNVLLNELIDDRRHRADEVDATITVASDLPPIIADRVRVLEVFENIVSNALKYACKEPGTLIELGADVTDAEHKFFVRDNGPGIEETYHEKIFDLFQRLEKSCEGSGVGLAIVARIMKVHQGRVWVESTKGSRGTTFWVAFPRIEAQVQAA